MLENIFGLIGCVSFEKFYIGVISILLFCILAVLLQRLSRKHFEKKKLDPEIVGGFFQVIGTVYAILIGLIVYDATDRYSAAHENVANESKALVSIFILSKQVRPDSVASDIRNMAKDYVREVLSHDWDYLQNEAVNKKARGLIRDINLKAISLSPETKNEEIIVPILIEASMDAWRYRMSRFDISTHSLPASEWILLLSGAVLTLFCSFFYYLECQASQSILTFLTAFVIASSLYAILMFSEPYKGDFAVSRKPFEIALGIMDESYFAQEVLNE